MSRRKVILVLLLVASVAAIAIAVQRNHLAGPERWNPWAELDVSATPNVLTRFKLARLSKERCPAVLADAGVDFEVLTDRQTGPDCGFTNAVSIRRTASDVVEAFPLTCRAAVSVALWERHVVQSASLKHLGQPVTRIEHFGSYSCRNVYGRPAATRSRHATAEAWDVAGFALADGRRLRVARDWQGTDSEAMFLREARDGACRFFDAVLSPDYNAAHHDHLHLDRGTFRLCR